MNEPRFQVDCIKADGVRRVMFKQYDDRHAADIDAAGLRKVGIMAEVVELPSSASAEAEHAESR